MAMYTYTICRLIKKKIEEGDGLPDMASQSDCVRALKSVGFEVGD
jgi:hypothetical protein